MKFSCNYYPLSFCKILKEFLEWIQSYEDVPFSGPKWLICPEQNFFGTNHYYYFHLPIDPFHCVNFKKFLLQIQIYEDARTIFGPKMVHLPQTNFFGKNINIILIYLKAPFIGQNFKKILPMDPEF